MIGSKTEKDTKTYEIKSSLKTSDEKLNELVELISLLFTAIDEIDLDEKASLINGTIHECDRMLSTYDVLRETMPSGTLPIDSPAFYNVYGQALYHLWFENYEMYLYKAQHYLKRALNDNSTEKARRFYNKLMGMKRELYFILKETVQKFKRAYEWACKDPSDVFHPKIEDQEKEDLEDYYLLDTCSDMNSIRAELTRSYLLYLAFHPFRLEASNPEHQVNEKMSKFLSSEKFINSKSKANSVEDDIMDILAEELDFIKEQILEILKVETSWAEVMKKHNIDPSDAENTLHKSTTELDQEDAYESQDDSESIEDEAENEQSLTLDSFTTNRTLSDPCLSTLVKLYERIDHLL